MSGGAVSGGAVTDGAPNDGVVVTAEDGVLRIVIDRPDHKGSLGIAGQRRIVAALEEASTDDSLRVVLLTSSGEDFCAGADWVASNRDGEPKPRPGSLQRRTPLAREDAARTGGLEQAAAYRQSLFDVRVVRMMLAIQLGPVFQGLEAGAGDIARLSGKQQTGRLFGDLQTLAQAHGGLPSVAAKQDRRPQSHRPYHP